MTPEDIKKLPTRETDNVTMLGDITDVVDLCRTLEKQRDAAVMALEQHEDLLGILGRETLDTIRSMK